MAERKRRTGTLEVERATGSHEVLSRLFVYGTIRRGQTARSLIAGSIVRCTGAHTTGRIYAFPMGYPGFNDDGSDRVVVGEVLWLKDLAATFALLDAYEGDDFARVIRLVTTAAGEEMWAWIYTLSDPEAVRLGTPIDHGDWVRYWSEHA